MILNFYLDCERTTEKMAGNFARNLSAPLVLGFTGNIGAGKTTFIRAMLRALDIKGAIKSPTYALVESYAITNLLIHHFDLYRVTEETELDFIGFRDYFSKSSLCCIEWPERTQMSLESLDLHLTFSVFNTGRMVKACAISREGCEFLKLISPNMEMR